MASTSKSIVEELLESVPMLTAFKLWPLVPYLSPDNAMTIEDFEQSELAEDYYIETINLRYGKLENKNHLFDVFAKFCGYEDSTYVHLDMLNYVAENTAWYKWDAHVLLKMHGSNLARWVATMTDCLNRGDELAIYAMCDMLKQHVFVFTHTKPWTTVDGSIAMLMISELCMMCDVRLIYLGNNKYVEIKCKPEVLSPLPKPIKFKCETPTGSPLGSLMLASPTQDVMVGILDKIQTSCTLVTLPTSPQATQIEASRSQISMKLVHEPLSGETESQNVETHSELLSDNHKASTSPKKDKDPLAPTFATTHTEPVYLWKLLTSLLEVKLHPQLLWK